MRSSKSRSRNKSNRNRSMGNIVNRVFDSSGPEGKVRGTPQQIIDKYTQLARDAQLGNDRVAAENFQQHAEHYTRMLGEALREQEARREAQDFQGQNQQNQNRDRGDRGDRGERDSQEQGGGARSSDTMASDQSDDSGDSGLIDVPEESGSGLVQTPESNSGETPKPRPRRPRRQKPAADNAGSGEGSPQDQPPKEAAE